MDCFPNKLRLIFIFILILPFLLVETLEIEERRLFTERQVTDDWASFQKYFNSQRVIHLYQPGLGERILQRILQLPLPELEELHFQQNIPKDVPPYRYRSFPQQSVSQGLLKTIFTSAYFPTLKTLNFKKTNIDQRYFEFLHNSTLQTTLETLILEDCHIGRRGFQLLAEVNWIGLRSLNVYNTLLKEGEAVDALIRMICGNGDNCTNSIEEINIGMTNIDSEGFIRLMSKINHQSLKRLRLRNLEMIYRDTYKQGFDYSAFQFLAKSFSQLQLLDLRMSLIDDEVAKIFSNWKLPNLVTLDLEDNHLTDQGISIWITKSNMPQLTQLFLLKNSVSDGTITHLASQAYEFKSFALGGKISEKGAESLDSLRTEKLQYLKLQFQIPSATLNRYILNNNFPNLRSLTLIKNDLLINAFTRVNWSRLLKLQSLTLQNIILKDTLTDLFQNKKEAVSASLKYLIINNPQLASQHAFYLVKLGPAYFPQLEQLIIADIYPVAISPEAFATPYKNGTFFDIFGMQLIRRGKIYELINLATLDFVITAEAKKYPSKLAEVARNYTFTTLERVNCNDLLKLDYFLTVLELAGIKELPYLRSLEMYMKITSTEVIRDRLMELSMPSLKGLILDIIIPTDEQDAVQSALLPFLQQLPLLSWITINPYFLNEETGSRQRKLLLDSLYFSHLLGFQMATKDMEVYEVQSFIRRHNKTVRSINLDNNFLEKGLLKVLVESEYILQALSLQSISLTVNEFSIFASLRTQFLYSLFLLQTELGNDHIEYMLSIKANGPFFPKLSILNLKGNSIHKEGLQTLLKTQMFRLSQLDLDLNGNPQYINLLLTYPTRIEYIQATSVDTYGILSDLQPRAARYIKSMDIKTKSFFREDFSSLARLNFSRMLESQLQVYNIYDCEVLRDFLLINRGVEDVRIILKNDKRGLNSSCLKGFNFTSHANYISIYDRYGTTYLPQFIANILKTNSAIKYLTLYNTKLPHNFIDTIFSQGSFSQLQILILEGNYLGDSGVRPLLKEALNNVVYLDLSNTDITASTVDALVGVKMSELRILALNKNKLDKKAIESIGKLQAKKLYALSLENCDLNGDSLEVITNFTFARLRLLILNFNNFQEADVLQFASNITRKRLPAIYELRLRGITLSKVGSDSLSQILATKNINYIIDPPEKVAKVNSAGY